MNCWERFQSILYIHMAVMKNYRLDMQSIFHQTKSPHHTFSPTIIHKITRKHPKVTQLICHLQPTSHGISLATKLKNPTWKIAVEQMAPETRTKGCFARLFNTITYLHSSNCVHPIDDIQGFETINIKVDDWYRWWPSNGEGILLSFAYRGVATTLAQPVVLA